MSAVLDSDVVEDRDHLRSKVTNMLTAELSDADLGAQKGDAGQHADDDLLAAELDAIRARIEATRGASDAAYVRRTIRVQRALDLSGRAALMGGIAFPPLWVMGVAALGSAKILENMEIGHNVMHGQWDWMRDRSVHSTTWEWDNVCPSSQWKHSHNYMHHQWTNVMGRDHDIGYEVLRVTPEQRWSPAFLFQPFVFVGLALGFEYGVGLHDLSYRARELKRAPAEEKRAARNRLLAGVREVAGKVVRQARKDYVLFPLLALPFGGVPAAAAVAGGALLANVIRNVWSFAVIFCGHFPDGVQVFTKAEADSESRGGWYRRQILGSANFTGGRVMDIASGNLNHQIEHHLFPDLPSNRYAQIAPEVQEICERHGLPYNTASFARQFFSVVRKVVRLSLP